MPAVPLDYWRLIGSLMSCFVTVFSVDVVSPVARDE